MGKTLLHLPPMRAAIFGGIFFSSILALVFVVETFAKYRPKNLIFKHIQMTAIAQAHICPEEKHELVEDVTFLLKKRFFGCKTFHYLLNLPTLRQHVEQ